jgi:hypothetical protein
VVEEGRRRTGISSIVRSFMYKLAFPPIFAFGHDFHLTFRSDVRAC